MLLLPKAVHKMDSGGLELLYYHHLICKNANIFITLTSLVSSKFLRALSNKNNATERPQKKLVENTWCNGKLRNGMEVDKED